MTALDLVSAGAVESRPLNQKQPELVLFAQRRLLLVLALTLAVTALAGGDLLEIIPAAQLLVSTTAFHYFHQAHDVIALGLALMAAYVWLPALGRLLIIFFGVIHIPYVSLTFPEEASEHVVLLLEVLVGLGGVHLISRLHRAVEDADEAAKVSRHLARHDPLTDLPNRELLNERVAQAVAATKRTGGAIALLYLDLDHFKDINDSLGHNVGDHVLMEIARRIRRIVRESDIVARLGGDEFAILATSVAEPEDLAQFADRLIDVTSAPLVVEGHTLYVSPSVGIAPFPLNGESEGLSDPLQLLACADMAMYRAKANGGNAFEFYDEAMSVEAKNRIATVHELRHALERDELILHYQPMMDIHSGSLIGAEALLRWNHPERGLVNPLEFIHEAETSGLIAPIGEWVLRTACAQNRAWQESGLPRIKVGVNLSPVQIRSKPLIETVLRALEETGLEPPYLDLEITESVLMRDVYASSEVLDELHSIGVTLSIDDFGTGYSSLMYLKQFQVDTLKIDSVFVRDIGGRDTGAIAGAVIKLGHSLGVKVMAEGVETEAQLRRLRMLGCDFAQGFYYSKPLPACAFTDLLRQSCEEQRPPDLGIAFY